MSFAAYEVVFVKKALLVLSLTLAVLLIPGVLVDRARADSGWTMDKFAADYTINADGSMHVVEQIDADFGSIAKHGIIRDLATRVDCARTRAGAQAPIYRCPDGSDRVYSINVRSVTDASGAAVPYETSSSDGFVQVKIGDPGRTVTGQHSYRITYDVANGLDAYDDHDELYWNATGTWDVMIMAAEVNVHLPQGTQVDAICYEGAYGTDERCGFNVDGNTATYMTARPLGPRQQLTIVTGWPRGIVDVAAPVTEDRTSIDDFFTFDWLEFAGMGIVAVLSLAGVIALWWRHGRDRRYRTLYYLTNDPSEETKALFGHTDVVVEFLPPDGLRPAQMGVILDERADTLDVTATIIDLAVRGYLHITEIPKKGWFGNKDWKLTQIDRTEPDDLQEYESALYSALFKDGKEVEISDLKNKFAERLKSVKTALYGDAMKRKWFSQKPETAKVLWLLVGLGIMAAGVGLSLLTGFALGRALIFVPLILAGAVMLVLSRAMARRTAVGSEALRRVLGFRLYVATAETRMQEFNEQQNIFARYLPFAIVFGCVDKWAKAFKGLEDQARQSTASWYTGVGAFEVMAFSSGLNGFASSVSTTMSSTPGSSGGGSGFSGGFSGGGGGGGGGSSW